MREIAKQSGVTHPLALYYFGSKEELWLAVMDRAMRDYEAEVDLESLIASDMAACEKLRRFIVRFVAYSAHTPQLHRILAMEGDQDTDRLHRLVEQHHRKVFDTVCAFIVRGQKDGTVRKGEPAILFYCIIGAGATLFAVPTEYRILTGRDARSAEVIKHTTDLILDSILI